MAPVFSIHALAAGGGHLALSPCPGRGGRLDRDVARIAEWGADLVVSMTQTAEMAACGAADMPARLGRVGIAWRHFPVVDFGAPGDGPGWAALSAEARGYLGTGGRVLIHCRGGCGRSGMAVLRLLVELGEDASTALARLRTARPCAVETDEQMDWARNPAPA